MRPLPAHLTADTWLDQIFASREALRGGVVKRRIRDVERLVGREVFLADVEKRGYQVVANNRHFVIFCNALPIRRARAFKGP